MQKAKLNQCFEVSLSVYCLQYIVLHYRVMHIMLQSLFDKTVTCSFSPFYKSLFIKELYSFHYPPCFWTLCGTVQLICLLVSCIVVAVLVFTRLRALH
jgi:hypothetical protein